MADESEREELLLDQPAPEGDEPGEQGSDEPGDLGEEELEITFDGEAAPASGDETGLVRHLRAEIRERDKRLSEYERSRLREAPGDPGPEPDFEDQNADWAFDHAKWRAAWDDWKVKKDAFDRTRSEREQQDRSARETWERDLQGHQAKRAALRFADVDEVEAVTFSALSEAQQAVIVRVAGNSAQLFYALGKHPAKLAELSKIADPLKMAAAVAVLEKGMSVMPRRRPPDPEQIASGSAGVTQRSDKHLERLEREAEQSGDRSKVIAYKRQLRTAA